MNDLVMSRNTVIFVLLVGATILSWELGHGLGFESVTAASVAVIAVSMIKARLVMQEFMEVRHAPISLRLVADGWLLSLSAALMFLYLR